LKILVDADACPVKQIIESVAKNYKLKVIMFIDTSHKLKSDYSEIVVVSQGKESVDIALINQTQVNDIIITQDYGLAAMGLSKKAFVINQNGLIYNDENINQLLFERFLSAKIRRSGGRTSNAKKRSPDNDKNFRLKFEELCKKSM
jgi:uncharacterized protein